MSRTSVSVTATGTQTPFEQVATDNAMAVQVSGTYAGLTFTFEGSIDNGSTFADIACVPLASMQIVPGGTGITPGTNATKVYRIPTENFTDIRVNVSAISSGTAQFLGVSGNFVGGVFSQMLIQSSTLTGDDSITGTLTVTSASASALTVGLNGATNPALKIDASTGSSATGIKITSAAAASGVAIAAISSGTNENLTIDAKGSGTITIGASSTGNVVLGTTAKTLTVANSNGLVTIAAGGMTITSGNLTLTSGNATMTSGNLLLSAGTITGTSASASALTVGLAGATNPALQVDASTASSATGIKIKSAAAASGVAVSVVSSGTDENLTIDAKGSGTITIGGTSTGAVILPTTNITDAKNVVLATTTGTSFGSATTQKLSFYGVTPITQPAASSAVSVTGTTGASTGVSLDTTFTGGGTAAYTIGGIVTKLKALGLLAT